MFPARRAGLGSAAMRPATSRMSWGTTAVFGVVEMVLDVGAVRCHASTASAAVCACWAAM
ncbi:hypothetical protein ACFPM0_13720 [Pseudonocardia sulfidoxydans]|uniref:hypothetical protein n=1 Tax=Pseudonocardia sulfidoxydans TaxID=54011 RepID=UPI0036064407